MQSLMDDEWRCEHTAADLCSATPGGVIRFKGKKGVKPKFVRVRPTDEELLKPGAGLLPSVWKRNT